MPKKCRQTKARKRTMLAMQRIRQVRWLKKNKLIKPDMAHRMLVGPLKGVMKWIQEKKYLQVEEPLKPGEKILTQT